MDEEQQEENNNMIIDHLEVEDATNTFENDGLLRVAAPKNTRNDIPPPLPKLRENEVKEGSIRVWGHGTNCKNACVPWKRAWAIRDMVNKTYF